MQAALLDGYGQSLRVAEVPDPIPADHEVVIRVMAVGLCHTDLHLIDGQPAILPGFPAILGHESAGVIESCGAAVTDWQIGAHVAVFGAQGCGACSRCTQDLENLCQEQTLSMNGIGRAGGFAHLMTVDARHLVDCGGLDSTEAAVLTDAGLTSYRAVMRAIGLRPDPGTIAIVGAGGLGQYAIQYARTLTSAHVIAIEPNAGRAQHALSLGADATFTPERCQAVLGSCDIVLDFVASHDTLALSSTLLCPGAVLNIVGLGEGTLPVGFFALPPEASITTTSWGSRGDLGNVFDLARGGTVQSTIQRYPLGDINAALADLRGGRITGRAVITPNC